MLLEEVGLLGSDVIAAHCIDLTDEDLEILHRNGVNVTHTPMSNSLGGNGVARVPEMLEQGINVSLGHDCFFTLDVSEYIRYAYLVHKAHNANPMLIPPFQILDMALGNGAKAMGLDQSIGSLQKGKKADIIIIHPDSPSPVVPSSVMSYFTMTFNGCDVKHVIVDGAMVVENSTMTTVDEEEVKKGCREEAAVLWRKNGIKV
jgi:cytosine/adenosine deaminase-related metal-dependent hydrolase